MKLIIPGELPSLNEIIGKSKSHWGKYHKTKKEETNKVAWLAKSLPPVERVELDITYYCINRRKDPDNIAAGGKKIILDGLVKAGVIANDGWKQVAGWRESWEVDKEKPRIEVEIKEVENE